MNLYLLRHETRGILPTFFTSLTDEGIDNAKTNIIKRLEKYNIKKIYCSPFLRTLQTIRYYCEKHSMQVNCENSLYEYLLDPIFEDEKKYYDQNDISDPNLINIISKKYTTFLPISCIQYPEDDELIVKRVKPFIQSIFDKKENNILLVSHMSTCNAIIKMFNPSRDINDWISLGGLIKIVIKNDQESELHML